MRSAALVLAPIALVGMLAAWYYGDPDRPLRAVQRAVGRGEPATLIGETGWPRYWRELVGTNGRAALDRDGFFTMDTMDDLALIEVARELPVPEYRLRAMVRHNKSLQSGSVGIYVGGHSASRPGQTAHLFSALRYNGIIEIAKSGAPAVAKSLPPTVPLVVPAGNPVNLETTLHVAAQNAAPWGEGFGGIGGVRIDPSGLGADRWRTLELIVRKESVQAFVDGIPLRELDLPGFDAVLSRDLAALIAKEPQERRFLEKLPRHFDPQGSVGMYLTQSSASFAEVVLTPLRESADE
jgi:hypothetical protein